MAFDNSASQRDASQTMSVDVVEAKVIVIKDDAGRVRAQFGLGLDGEAQLRFWNAEGKHRVAIGVCKVPGLWLFDNDGRPRVELSLNDDSDCIGLHLRDEAGSVRASLNYRNGETHMKMFDAKERQQVVVTSGPCGNNLVAILDTHEAVKVGLISGDGMAGTLCLADAVERAVAGIQITDHGDLAVVVDTVNKVSMAQAGGERPIKGRTACHKCDRTPLDLDLDLNN